MKVLFVQSFFIQNLDLNVNDQVILCALINKIKQGSEFDGGWGIKSEIVCPCTSSWAWEPAIRMLECCADILLGNNLEIYCSSEC